MSQQIDLENRLLQALPESDRRQLNTILTPVHLTQEQSLYVQGDAYEYLYFPLDAVVSTVAIMGDGATVEVFMTGREGVTGIVSVFGDHSARNWTRVLIAGSALRAKADVLRQLFTRSEEVQRVMLNYYRSLITQISQRAVCNGRHTILQRLACWMQMLHDRVGADEIRLTQEEMAGKLGVRRAGVTQAARALLASGAVNYNHGRINVLDRYAIESVACECYKVHRENFDFPGEKIGGGKSRATGPPPDSVTPAAENRLRLLSERRPRQSPLT
ncbi:MAG TPA: Crp/Fnr family transcriptional regulator [Pyrinomonadaceae bacterium]|nr:Crp/Fnr family transcriptional regulator [Pyrinomonadaceae bacterium]